MPTSSLLLKHHERGSHRRCEEAQGSHTRGEEAIEQEAAADPGDEGYDEERTECRHAGLYRHPTIRKQRRQMYLQSMQRQRHHQEDGEKNQENTGAHHLPDCPVGRYGHPQPLGGRRRGVSERQDYRIATTAGNAERP